MDSAQNRREMFEDIRGRNLTCNGFSPLKSIISLTGPVRTDSRGRVYIMTESGTLRRWDKMSKRQKEIAAKTSEDITRLLREEAL